MQYVTKQLAKAMQKEEMVMNKVNATKFTGVTVEGRGDLREKVEALEIMENRKDVAIAVGAGAAMLALSLAVASHPLAEMVMSSNHLKEIKIVEAAKNARWEMTLGFVHQTVNDVLNTISFVPGTQRGCIF